MFNTVFAFTRKYKLLHIIFWLWSAFSLYHVIQENRQDNTFTYYDVVTIIVFQMVCVYTLVYVLMPRFLNKKKYFKFIFLAIGLILISGILSVVVQDIYTWLIKDRHISFFTITLMLISRIIDLIIHCAVFFAIYSIDDKLQSEKKVLIAEKERLANELNFLKAQLNPHFLFNALNSIYVLIQEDQKLATDTVLKFSGLLRYQLYDCTNAWMPLDRELEFLRDYIDLEKMRCNDNLNIVFEVSGTDSNYEIAPFILSPFVENAFKHRSNFTANNFIKITAIRNGDILNFSVINSYNSLPERNEHTPGGIGLPNVKRRLELLYSNAYALNIDKSENTYTVNLQLKLHENEMYHRR